MQERERDCMYIYIFIYICLFSYIISLYIERGIICLYMHIGKQYLFMYLDGTLLICYVRLISHGLVVCFRFMHVCCVRACVLTRTCGCVSVLCITGTDMYRHNITIEHMQCNMDASWVSTRVPILRSCRVSHSTLVYAAPSPGGLADHLGFIFGRAPGSGTSTVGALIIN